MKKSTSIYKKLSYEVFVDLLTELFLINSEIGSSIKVKLKSLKYELAKLFKGIFEACSIKPFISNLDNPAFGQDDQFRIQEQDYVNYFLQVCTDIMEDKRFLSYYEEKFSLNDQILLMVQLTNNQM